MRPHTLGLFSASLAAAVVALGCDSSSSSASSNAADAASHDDHDHDHDAVTTGDVAEQSEEDMARDEACEHSVDGPFVDATPGTDAATAATVAPHTVYRFTLAAGSKGWFKLPVAATAHYALAVNEDVPVSGSSGGTALALTDIGPGECTTLAHVGYGELPVGDALLEVGPVDAETAVSLVVHVVGQTHDE